MNEMGSLDRLVRAARKETAPHVDVTGRVMQQIHDQSPAVDASFAIFAATSSVAAAIVAIVAVQTWLAWQDPIATMLCSLDVVLQ